MALLEVIPKASDLRFCRVKKNVVTVQISLSSVKNEMKKQSELSKGKNRVMTEGDFLGVLTMLAQFF